MPLSPARVTFPRWGAIACILLISLGLRLPQIGDSLWLDELHSSWTIHDGIEFIGERARMGNNSPLYFYLPWLAVEALGETEFAIRLPSLIAGVAIPLLTVHALLRRYHCGAAAHSAAFVFCIDPNFLFYSIEARPYAIIQLLAVLQVAAFLEYWRNANPRDWWITVGLSLLLFHFHCTTSLLFLAELVTVLIAALASSPPSWRDKAVLANVLAGLLAFAMATLASCRYLLDLFGRRYAWSAFVQPPDVTQLLTVFPLLATCGLPALAMGAYCKWRRNQKSSDPPAHATQDTRILAALYATGLVIPWLIGRVELAPIFYRRYLIALSVIPPFLMASMLASISNRSWRLTAAIGCCLVTLCWIGPLPRWWQEGHPIQPRHEDWRSAVQFVHEHAAMGDSQILVRSGLIEADRLVDAEPPENAEFQEYCCLPVRGIYSLDGFPLKPLPYTNPWTHLPESSELERKHRWIIGKSTGSGEPPPGFQKRGSFGRVIIYQMIPGDEGE